MNHNTIDITGSKILIVDDKKENLELLTEILEIEGYEIAFAQDGLKAIEIATIYQPDLILLDVMMPGIDGFETCQRMKSITLLRDIPIIFVTAKADISDVMTGFNTGAVDYVTKPIRHEEIIARVSTHIKLGRLLTIRDELIDQLRLQNLELENVSKMKDQQLEESQKLTHMGEMVGELTHELCTPLGIINTAITGLMEKRNALERELSQGKLSKTSLEQFLQLSKESFDISFSNLNHTNQLVTSFKGIVVGEFSGAKTMFELKHFLDDIYFLMMPKIKRSPYDIKINCAEDIVLNTQSGALAQVIINLINNAFIHAFEPDIEGIVTIDAYKNLDSLTINISDTGKGIDKEAQNKIFNKYFTTKMGKGGSGLGLFITKKQVEQKLNGKITYQQNEPHGACFSIVLPLTNEVTE